MPQISSMSTIRCSVRKVPVIRPLVSSAESVNRCGNSAASHRKTGTLRLLSSSTTQSAVGSNQWVSIITVEGLTSVTAHVGISIGWGAIVGIGRGFGLVAGVFHDRYDGAAVIYDRNLPIVIVAKTGGLDYGRCAWRRSNGEAQTERPCRRVAGFV